MKIISAVIAVTGLLTIGIALSASHALHVQIKTISSTVDAPSRQNAEALSQSVDTVCLIFGALGTIQLGCGLFGGRIRRKERVSNQNLEHISDSANAV